MTETKNLKKNSLYEVVLLCSPHLSQGGLWTLTEKVQSYLDEKEGHILTEPSEYWGLRNLAYELRKDRKRYKKAHYILFYLDIQEGELSDFRHFLDFRCKEEVLRFMILKVKKVPEERSELYESSIAALRSGGVERRSQEDLTIQKIVAPENKL